MSRSAGLAKIVPERRAASFALLALGVAIVCALLVGPARAEAFPVTTVHGIPEGWTNSDVTFDFTVDFADSMVETRYSLNGAAFFYSGPVTVTAEGTTTVVFRSNDSHTAREDWQTAYVLIDRTAPATTILGLPTGWVAPGAYGFSLVGADGLSFVQSTFYRIDNGDAVRYTGGTVPVFASSGVSVEYWSVDAAGNQESPHTALVRIDNGGPFTVLSGLPSGWSRFPVTFSLAAESAQGTVAGTLYRLGAGAEVPYVSPVTVSAEGATALTYRSVDSAGVEESARGATVRIDSTAPISSAAGFVSGWARDPLTIVVTTYDALSGPGAIYFGPVGGPMSRYGAQAVVNLGEDGEIQYAWYAVDAAGNAEQQQTRTVKMDRTAPTSWASGLPLAVVRDPVAFSLGAQDAGSGLAAIYYSLDGGPAIRYVSGDVSITKRGTTTVAWWATDVAGNIESRHTSSIFISSVGPTTSASGVPAGWTSSDVTVTLTPTPGDVPITSTRYRIDQGSWEVYSADPLYRTWVVLTDEGTHVVGFYSIDQVGNTESEKTAVVRIDKTPPVMTGAVTGGGTGRATFSANANDALSGVAHIWCSLDGQAVVDATALVVTAPGSHAIVFRAVDAAGNSTLEQTARFTVVGPPPPPDATGPHTSSDAVASYIGTATVRLTATPGDAAVVHTYHRLDRGPQVEGTTIVVAAPGAHMLEFWSQDAAGNVESPHAAAFTVVGASSVRDTALGIATTATSARIGRTFILSGRVSPNPDMVGRVVHVDVKKPGRSYWSYSSARAVYSDAGSSSWWYRYTLVRSMIRGTYRFKAVFDGDALFTSSSSAEVAVSVR